MSVEIGEVVGICVKGVGLIYFPKKKKKKKKENEGEKQ